MTVANVVRHTVSLFELVGALGLLAIAVFHAAWGISFAVLPAIGGSVLLSAAIYLTPFTSHRFRRQRAEWNDVAVFLGTLAVAVVALVGFIALGSIF